MMADNHGAALANRKLEGFARDRMQEQAGYQYGVYEPLDPALLPPLYIAYANSVRAGSAEMVCAGDPTNLGYLTVWAADYLARGHTLTFTPGSYNVGGPVGTVHYYGQNEELPLGQPLTITKANLAQYGVTGH